MNLGIKWLWKDTSKIKVDKLKKDVKANTASITNLENTKANKTYVDNQLNGKADISYVNNQLNGKADTTYVNDQLSNKADTTYVNNQLNSKADISYVDARVKLKLQTPMINEGVTRIPLEPNEFVISVISNLRGLDKGWNQSTTELVIQSSEIRPVKYEIRSIVVK